MRFSATFRPFVSVLALTAAFPGTAMAETIEAPAAPQASLNNADTPVFNYVEQQEIIVTGRSEGYLALDVVRAAKTGTPILDIPQTISVLTREQIDDQALQDIGDILRYTPGTSIGQGEGNRDQITIRGQNTTADFFIDGIRDDVQYFRPLYNLERVEILKGANALLFGRGGGGGVINRVTKTPVSGDTFASATASVDTFGALYVSGDINAAIADNAGLRINALYEELANHRDVFEGRRYAVNPTFAANLGEKSKILLSYEYVNDDRVTDRGIPSAGGGTLANPARPARGLRDTFFGSPEANVTTLEAHILRARFEHKFSDSLSYNTTVQYADYDKLYQNLYPTGLNSALNQVTLQGYLDTTDRQNLIIQGNLLWNGRTGPIEHDLLIGYEFGDQQSDNARFNALFPSSGSDSVSFAFSDPLAIPAFSFPVSSRATRSDVEFLSFYVQDQIALGDHFDVVAGVRYDRFEIDVNDIRAGRQLSRTDEKFSPRVGLIYKPIEPLSFYVSYSKSFLPRSGDQFLSLTPSTATLAPETFDNYEIGAKWEIRPSLRLTTALFQLDRENGVAVDPANPNNSILTGSRTKGFEVQLAGEIMPGWQVNAGYSYLDGEERGRIVGNTLQNRVLSQVPRHTASLWNRYEVNDRFGVGMGVVHQASQFASISNAVKVPSFTRVDAALFLKLSDRIEAQVNVENLFDTAYFPSAHNDENISTGEPLNARFTIKARF